MAYRQNWAEDERLRAARLRSLREQIDALTEAGPPARTFGELTTFTHAPMAQDPGRLIDQPKRRPGPVRYNPEVYDPLQIQRELNPFPSEQGQPASPERGVPTFAVRPAPLDMKVQRFPVPGLEEARARMSQQDEDLAAQAEKAKAWTPIATPAFMVGEIGYTQDGQRLVKLKDGTYIRGNPAMAALEDSLIAGRGESAKEEAKRKHTVSLAETKRDQETAEKADKEKKEAADKADKEKKDTAEKAEARLRVLMDNYGAQYKQARADAWRGNMTTYMGEARPVGNSESERQASLQRYKEGMKRAELWKRKQQDVLAELAKLAGRGSDLASEDTAEGA